MKGFLVISTKSYSLFLKTKTKRVIDIFCAAFQTTISHDEKYYDFLKYIYIYKYVSLRIYLLVKTKNFLEI